MPLMTRFKRSAKQVVAPNLLSILAKPGQHETLISQGFDGQVRFEGDAPVFDQPLVLIGFTNRSGSNLLADYMLQAGRVGGAGEFMNHDFVLGRKTRNGMTRFPELIRQLQAETCKGGKALALKASWDQMAMLLRWNIPAMFPRCIVLHTVRNDLMAQAVSFAIALRTGQWTSRQAGAELTDEVPGEDVLAYIEAFQRANQLIRLVAEAHDLPRWEVSYERMCADPQGHVGSVLRAAGLAGPGWTARTPAISKQSNHINDAVAEGIRAQIRACTQ